MNRQIKFRGKDLATGKWVYGDLLHPITSCRIVNYTEVEEDGVKRADYHYYDVDPDTIGQFTGLYDRAGTSVYEGDIIKSPCGNVVGVEFGYNEEVVQLKGFPTEDSFASYGWIVRNLQNGLTGTLDNSFIQGKVIGNVADHPELLEK